MGKGPRREDVEPEGAQTNAVRAAEGGVQHCCRLVP